MLNWIRSHSVGVFAAFFISGAVCAALLVAFGGSANVRLLAIGVMVCVCVLLITLLARITIWCAKRYMSESLISMRWDMLSIDQFNTVGLSARISFIAQHLGLFAFAFAFGWMLLTMFLVFFGDNK